MKKDKVYCPICGMDFNKTSKRVVTSLMKTDIKHTLIYKTLKACKIKAKEEG